MSTSVSRTVSAGVTRSDSIRIRWSLLGLVVMLDQMLLPMFHAGPVPFKISYVILGFWSVWWLTSRLSVDAPRFADRDFLRFAAGMILILAAGLLGQAWLSITMPVESYSETLRISVFYLLTVMAFGLGLHSVRLDLRWLVKVFYLAVGLNLLFSLIPEQLPNWLAGFYYSDRAVAQVAQHGGELDDVMALDRPRGLFGNPNVSAHLVNLLALFIHLAVRNHLLAIRSIVSATCIIVLPVVLASLLATRGEFAVALVLAVLNYRVLGRRISMPVRLPFWVRAIAIASLILVSGVSVYMFMKDDPRVRRNLDRTLLVFGAGEDRIEEMSGATRYLIFMQIDAPERFLRSPLFGTGFEAAPDEAFSHGTLYYHNDWARLLVTSGIVGFIAMLYLLWRFAWPLGWPVLIPWVLPGLINSFMLVIPAFLSYWFMLALLRQKLRIARAGS
jgi:hypothetical protein